MKRKKSEADELYLAEFDEINRLGTYLYEEYEKANISINEIKENLNSVFIQAFRKGVDVAVKELRDEFDITSDEYAYWMDELDRLNSVETVINTKIDGKTWDERLEEHLLNLDGASSIEKIVETETHRDMNAGIYEVGKLAVSSGHTDLKKTWKTMLDERVRDTHSYLEGVTVGMDEEFYTYNGNHAYYPSQFGVPEEDCNCRCRVTYSK